MAQSAVLGTGSASYPGPSQAELGSLVDWVSDTDFAQLQASPRPARPPSVAPAYRPPHRRRPERYSGPTREELGDLGAWLDLPKSPPQTRGTSERYPATSIHALESEIWVSETWAGLSQGSPEPGKPMDETREPGLPDPFLDQLDEIEAALRKRSRA